MEGVSDNEIRVMVAGALGWKHEIRRSYRETPAWFHPNGVSMYDTPPDYLNDLNACAEFEKTLRDNQFHYVNYPHILFEVVAGHKWDGDLGYFAFNFIHADASQRCEAFLKTKGLWKE